MDPFRGMKIIESVWMTEPGEPVQVRRSWRERWLARPWRPWKATKMITPQVPMRAGYQMGDAVVMHPETLRQLKATLAQEDEG